LNLEFKEHIVFLAISITGKMQTFALLLACFVFVANGRRAQKSHHLVQEDVSGDEQSLADVLLLSLNPAPAIKSRSLGTNDRRTLSPSMGQAGDIRVGKQMEIDGELWKCLEFVHKKQARQAGMVWTKLKNMQTGTTVEKTFRLTETFDEATIDNVKMAYSYEDGSDYVFMNMETFEEARVPSDSIVGKEFISDGLEIDVVYWKDEPIDIQLPSKVTVKVIDQKGGPQQKAVIEGGAVVTGVPDYIAVDEEIIVDPSESKFLDRAVKKKLR
jgi:elongation factor P